MHSIIGLFSAQISCGESLGCEMKVCTNIPGAHVLLNLLNELRERENARLAGHFISFSQRV